MLFEVALVVSILNLIIFLTLETDRYHGGPRLLISRILNSSIAPFCMLTEFFLLNTIPLVLSHYTIVLFLVIVELLSNAVVSLVTDQGRNYQSIPTYQYFQPRNLLILLTSFCILLASFALFLIFKQMSLIKLRMLGYRDMSRTVAARKKLDFMSGVH